MRKNWLLSIALVTAGLLRGAAQDSPSFQKSVQPLLSATCIGCHNQKLASGGLNIAPFLMASSLSGKREGWERILAKLRTGYSAPQADATLLKAFRITERHRGEIRFSAFNITNTPIFGSPNTSPTSPLFGSISKAQINLPRECEIALRYRF